MIPEKLPLTSVLSVMGGLGLAGFLWYLNLFEPAEPPAPSATKIWQLPSCPLEVILQDGTRWAKPDWSAPNCRAAIGWRMEP